MKFFAVIFLSAVTLNAFGDEDLSKAFDKRKDKDCVRLLSNIRKSTRTKLNLTGNIEKVEIGTNKDSKFALLYLKLKNGEICSEQPSKTERGTVHIQYKCRDKNGKSTIERSIAAGNLDCDGDAPKFQ